MSSIKFPLEIDPIRKTLVVVNDAEIQRSHILSWLQTEKYERVMRNSYGLTDYLFESVNDISKITDDIKTGLELYVPDSDFEVYGEINELGETLVNVFWSWKSEQQSTFQVTL